jgi:hypothetical protein
MLLEHQANLVGKKMKKYEDNELEDIQVSQSLACYVPN